MRVLIVGLGLMGGSLARALHRNGDATVVGVDINAATRSAAHGAGIMHQVYASLSEFDGLFDVLVFATPVSATLSLMRTHAARLRRIPLVMDVGNVKGPIADAAVDNELQRVFVGAHPVCGSERSGFGASRADLYDGAPVWLVGGDDAPLQEAERFWRSAGAAALRRTDGSAHDELVGAANHLPHLVAGMLGGTLAELGIPRERLGPGARDTTRLAGAEPELWLDTLMHNRAAVLAPLQQFAARLDRARAALEEGDADALLQLLAEGSQWQRR
jgi:prephenate dehydrogenase